MELAKVGRNDEALESYAILRAQNPDYPSGYFQAALLLQRLSRLEEARTWLKEGIEAATRVKDAHARREMEGVLAELELDEG
jgi:tetratricopeptide (TPR) repeat protein